MTGNDALGSIQIVNGVLDFGYKFIYITKIVAFVRDSLVEFFGRTGVGNICIIYKIL